MFNLIINHLKIEIMTNSRTVLTGTRVAGLYVNRNGIGQTWKERKEYTSDFDTVDDFINKFTPVRLTAGLRDAISSAFKNCSRVTFNIGNGNRTFYFKSK